MVCLTAQLFLLLRLLANVGLPSPKSAALQGPPTPALPRVLSARLPICTPPADLDECFFFNSLVVRLPYSSISCQFWLFLVFTFVVVLLVLQGGTVCLPVPPSWPVGETEVFFLYHETVLRLLLLCVLANFSKEAFVSRLQASWMWLYPGHNFLISQIRRFC